MASSGSQIVVIGAGVTGLQTSVSLLEAGYGVTIIAKHFPGDKSIEYTSPWAGAHWRTHAPLDDHEQQKWDVESYNYWLSVLENERRDKSAPVSGLGLYDSHFFWVHPDPEVPGGDPNRTWFAPQVLSFKAIPKSKLLPGIHAAATFQSVMINVPQYLKYLLQRATSLGANLIRAALPTDGGLSAALTFAETLLPPHLKTVDVWVNATGLGAGRLVPDEKMFPIRGQTIIVKGEAQRITTVEDKNPANPNVTYILPRPGGGRSVLGGTKQANNWQGTPDEETTKEIIERAKKWAPELLTGKDGGFEVLDVCVGFRPGRTGGVRVEIEKLGDKTVCHAYGHAGAGYQNSIGSAQKVVRLIRDSIESPRTVTSRL
ncbi:nucleotide-binding domain-containing protein [Rhizodiscina lignyota]|uniref:Nucleotide-binding domain-containing protein n=1 Tax=Rhizodiscina lignyota TaxID=1504668 RepID=A0A9P4M877_9PEZI|nr:nucleotide-binding domain-containing protein [Rhizodiscina lignyota]